LPNIPESYVHRIGRTGRAGASGIAIAFCDAEEKEYLRDIQKLIGKKIPVNDDHAYELKIHNPVKEAPKQFQRPQHQKAASQKQGGGGAPQGRSAQSKSYGEGNKSSNPRRPNNEGRPRFKSPHKQD
jgi:ATP-dependent RNA helicase RhlE